MATVHYSPFLDDRRFDEAYWRVATRWPGGSQDLRWRVWVLTRCARQAQKLGGSFAEFGTYRGAYAYMVLSETHLRPDQKFYLFDTFAGMPGSHLTPAERDAGFKGRMGDTSAAEVAGFLRAWERHVCLVIGDVFETLSSTETGPVALGHLDLNAAAPTRAALDYVYPRLVEKGILVLDDYGWAGYVDQRRVIEEFFGDKPEEILPLPTGQAIVAKL